MTKYVVNRLTIEETTRDCRIPYHGANMSSSWRPSAPFGAALGYPSEVKEPELYALAKARKPKNTSLHLGYYDDCRKAAYVVAYYLNDRKTVLEEWGNGDIDISFPAELFNLPEYMTLAEAQAFIEVERIKKIGPPKPFDTTKGEKALNKAYNFKVHRFNDSANLSDALEAMEKLILERISYVKAAEQVMETYTYRR